MSDANITVEQWLPEISKADAVDNHRPISSSIFADAWLETDDVKAWSFISVADLVCGELFRHREAVKKWVGGWVSENYREGRILTDVGCFGQDRSIWLL